MAISPGSIVVSASDDATIRVWDLITGLCLRTLKGHTEAVYSVAISANGSTVVSGAADATLRVWDLATGRCLRTLEGHTEAVYGVAISPDGSTVVSGAADATLRVWPLDAGNSRNLINYSNAKVLLVGDTGVGKSGLAERLVHKRFTSHVSTHARKAETLELQIVEQDGGQRHQETILWDLAGQPAYRLVHQLSMEDAVLALVLIDARTDPYDGPGFWAEALGEKLPKLLVGSRKDVGGLADRPERIEEFRLKHGFVRFIPTSAQSGEGCEELREAIRGLIDWSNLPTITTTVTLAEMRKHCRRLKDEGRGLLTVRELFDGYQRTATEKASLEDFILHLDRLEATDDVLLLAYRSTGAPITPETQALVDPTRMDAYASAILVAAKDVPTGPGHLEEEWVRDGKFELLPEERLKSKDQERHLLGYVVERLVQRDLALREKIGDTTYLVFPSQCVSELPAPGPAPFGVAFEFSGFIGGIYATLIAQLAHYHGFAEKQFYKDSATYRPEAGGLCIVRLKEKGRAELHLSFDPRTPLTTRRGFIDFVEGHLAAKCSNVNRRNAYHCAHCGRAIPDDVVAFKLAAKSKTLPCSFCEKKTPFQDLFADLTTAAKQVVRNIQANAAEGRRKMTADSVIRSKERENVFDVFLCHTSSDKPMVEEIGRRLLDLGIRPWLDKWNLKSGVPLVEAIEQVLSKTTCAAIFFGATDPTNFQKAERNAIVALCINKEARMLPVLLTGAPSKPSIPNLLVDPLYIDMRKQNEPDDDSFYRLVCGIFNREPGAYPTRDLDFDTVRPWHKATKRR